jgi:hypothetical protein
LKEKLDEALSDQDELDSLKKNLEEIKIILNYKEKYESIEKENKNLISKFEELKNGSEFSLKQKLNFFENEIENFNNYLKDF